MALGGKAGEWNRVRKAATLLAAALLGALLCSAFYPALEAGHDCTGEDCPICACTELCEEFCRGFGGCVILAVAVLLQAAVFSMPEYSGDVFVLGNSPILLRVRMNR